MDKRAFAEALPLPGDKIRIFSREYQSQVEFKIDEEAPAGLFKPIWTIVSKLKEYGLKKGFELRIWSEIPPGAGMGSSAAVAVAATAAISSLFGITLSKREICDISFEAEKDVHGTPSGVDNTIATYGSAIIFRRGKMRRIEVKGEVPFVVGDTGVKRSTKDWVAKVRGRRERCRDLVDPVIKLIGKISLKGARLLMEGRLPELGELMDLNQGLLDALGVSTRELSNLIFAARSAGAYGAKLTGAGGGGCMIALTAAETSSKVARAIQVAGGIPITANISMDGVRIDVDAR